MHCLISSPKSQCEKGVVGWIDVLKFIRETFAFFGIQIQIFTRKEPDCRGWNPSHNDDQNAEQEIENYTNEWTREKNELETVFTRDSKSRQPPCNEQFPIRRPKQRNDGLFENYFQYQP